MWVPQGGSSKRFSPRGVPKDGSPILGPTSGAPEVLYLNGVPRGMFTKGCPTRRIPQVVSPKGFLLGFSQGVHPKRVLQGCLRGVAQGDSPRGPFVPQPDSVKGSARLVSRWGYSKLCARRGITLVVFPKGVLQGFPQMGLPFSGSAKVVHQVRSPKGGPLTGTPKVVPPRGGSPRDVPRDWSTRHGPQGWPPSVPPRVFR